MLFGLLIGAALGVGKALFGAKGKSDQAQSDREANLVNERFSRESADITRAGTNLELQRQERNTFRALGSTRAAAGASGVTQSGSVLDVLRSSVAEATVDKGLISTQGALDARGFERQAAESAVLAQGAQQRKKAAGVGGILGAASSLLGAFG